MSAPPRRRGRILLAAGAALLLVVVVGVVAAFLLTRDTGDVVNRDVEFQAEPTQTAVPEEPADPKKADTFKWPIFGFTKDRRRYLPAQQGLRPPFHRVWTMGGKVLLEFPPVLAGPRLFVMKNSGAIYAASKRTGQILWRKKVGRLAAASPAVTHRAVYGVVLERGKGIRKGRVIALRQSDGKVLWDRLLPSRSESSPVIDGERMYIGSENGTVYSIDVHTGAVRWTFKASGAVKSGLALADGKLYFGDYAGRVYAIRQRDGSRAWSTGTSGARFGLSSGNFYGTPAVAYGRVYLGNTDGNVYSFSSLNGKLAWRKKTGGFVYSSPAIAHVPGGRPTVYIGSYDKKLYALHARDGRVLWSHKVTGRISGAPTVIGDIVYFSELDRKRTYGVGARTGRRVFEFGRGQYTPVVSDGRMIYLTGYSSVYALRPLSAEGREQREKAERRQRRSRAAARRAARTRDRALQNRCWDRANRLHDRRGPVVRSFRTCVRRERAEATRAACRRRAEKVHNRHSRVIRSVRACARRNRR
jgi:outer membrane protein assembly factor BamB